MRSLRNPLQIEPQVATTSEQLRVAIVAMVARAWEAAGVAVDCELCGNVDWGYVGTDTADGLALPLRRAASVDLGAAFLTYAVTCKSCGNVRLMSKNRVEELAGRDPSLG